MNTAYVIVLLSSSLSSWPVFDFFGQNIPLVQIQAKVLLRDWASLRALPGMASAGHESPVTIRPATAFAD